MRNAEICLAILSVMLGLAACRPDLRDDRPMEIVESPGGRMIEPPLPEGEGAWVSYSGDQSPDGLATVSFILTLSPRYMTIGEPSVAVRLLSSAYEIVIDGVTVAKSSFVREANARVASMLSYSSEVHFDAVAMMVDVPLPPQDSQGRGSRAYHLDVQPRDGMRWGDVALPDQLEIRIHCGD